MDKHLNKYNLAGLLIAAWCIYYLLLQNMSLPFSIHSVLESVRRFDNQWPLLAVGLLPIYVAFVIFGIAGLGFYMGSLVEKLVTRFQRKRSL